MKKTYFKNLILSFFAVVFICSIFTLANLTTFIKTASAASPVEHFDNKKADQTQLLNLNSIINGKQTYILDASYFEYRNSNNKNGNESNGSTLVHKIKGPTLVEKNNGQFLSVVSISKPLSVAMKYGYVSVSASATLTTKNCGFYWVKDSAETIYFDLFAYNFDENSLDSQIANTSAQSNGSFGSENHTLELDYDLFKSKDFLNTIELSFKSSLAGAGAYNYMEISNPILEFVTKDLSEPTVSIDFDKSTDEWTNSRQVTIEACDYESGIQKIEYKLGNNEWVVFDSANYAENLEYVTEKTLTHYVNTNETFKVRVTDNVGHSVEKEYTENHIDTVAPSITVDFNRLETDLAFDFKAILQSNHTSFVSPENYYYTYLINGGEESDKISLINGQNHFESDEVGEYTFTFYATDLAGNSMTPLTVKQVFKKKIIIEDVQEIYVYSDLNIDLNYSIKCNGSNVSEAELNKAGFKLLITQNGEATYLKNAGSYSYEFVCDNEFYLIEKSGTITIQPYSLTLTLINNVFEYDRNQKQLEFSLDKEVPVVVSYTDLNGNPVSPISIGNYFANVRYERDNNYQIDVTHELNIIPHKLKVIANDLTIEYGKLSLNYADDINNYFSMTVLGLLDGDVVNFDIVCDYAKDVGTYIISFKQKISDTSENSQVLKNYDVEYIDGVLEITKATVYIMPAENQTKVYSESDPASFAYTLSGLVYDDTLTVNLIREVGEDVGFYPFTLSSYENKNYNLVVIPASFQITKRIAYVIVDNNQSKTYGDADPIFTFSLENSNVLEYDIEFIQRCIIRENGERVGTYNLSFDKTKAKNYAVVFFGSVFNIYKRDLTIIADNIFAEYGEEQLLTYKTIGLVDGDTLSGSLEREQGVVLGEYKINQGTLANSNYNIKFVEATYVIDKKHITIQVNNSTKKYGESDNLTYTVFGTNNLISVILEREQGENVGTYLINSYVFEDSNYEVEFVAGTLEIIPTELNIKINSASKIYGDVDPQFTYVVDGLVNGETIKFNIIREVGESANVYKLTLDEIYLQNYVIKNVEEADFEIKKADVELVLKDKTVTYSGSAVNIDLLETNLNITYTYTTKNGQIIEPANIVNAGEYKVYASFAGDENHNESTSNIATIIIKQKFIPITLKKCAFNYTGKAQAPEFDINLNEDISVIVTYVSGIIDPTEVGEYDFIITSNDINYTCSLTDIPFGGTLVIFEGFMSSTTGAQAVSDSVGLSSFGIQLFEDSNSSLRSKFNALRDGRRCLSVYNFKTTEEFKNNGEVITVSIKVTDNKDVKIYTVDASGRMCAVSYTIKGGYYVLSVNDISSSILVTASDNTMYFAKIISVTILLFLCYFITKTVRRNKRNHFFKRNTTIKYVDFEELKANSEIVEEVSFTAEVTSGNTFIDG